MLRNLKVRPALALGAPALCALALGAVALCALAAGLWWLAGRGARVSATQLTAALPASVSTIVYVDVSRLREAGILARLAGSHAVEDAEYRIFIDESGFDYRRDLDRLALGLSGDTRFLALAGRFHWKALERYARTHGGRCEAAYCRMPASLAGQTVSFYAARSSWIGHAGVLALAIGPSDSAARSVGLVPGAAAAGASAATPLPSQPVWISTTGKALRAARGSLPPGTLQFMKLLENAERLVFALGPDQNNFELTLDAVCPTPQDAAVLVVQLDALTGMVRKIIASEKRQPNPRDFSGLLTEGSFRKDDRRVTGRWPVRHELVDALTGSS